MNSISSTRTSDGRVRLLLGLAAGLFLTWAGLGFGLGRLAKYEESERGRYLWYMEEWLQLLQPHDFVGRGDRMIFLAGASEAREGLLYEVFGAAFPGQVVYHGAQSLGIMRSVLLQIEYIDRVYGPSGFPHRIVLGVNPRFIYNVPSLDRTPIFTAISRYSPRYDVEDTGNDYRFVEKDRVASLQARYRFLTKQTRRYRNALRAVAHDIVARVAPALADANVLTVALRPYKYHHLRPFPSEEHYAHFRSLDPVPYTVDGPDGQAVRTDAARLMQIVARNGAELYVVAMPEGAWMAPHYAGTFHDDYMELLRSAYAGVPVLDLRHLLGDGFFYDRSHATRAGGERISRAIADWMKESAGPAHP